MAHPVTPRAPSRSKARWLALALLLVAAAVGLWLLAQRDGSDDGRGEASQDNTTTTAEPSSIAASRVAEFEGPGDAHTGSFRVARNWEIRWAAQADSGFAVELLTAGGTSRGMIIEAQEGTSGSTYVSQAGEFKLRVISRKPWSMEILSQPAED